MNIFSKLRSAPAPSIAAVREVSPTNEFSSIPILQSPRAEYPSLDDPMTEKEIGLIATVKSLKSELLANLPKDVSDGKSFDAEAWIDDESNILRYVRARKGKIEDIKKALIKTLKWRLEYRPHAIKLSQVEIEMRTGKEYLNGFDPHGRPILFLKPQHENTKDPDNQIRCIVFLMETAVKMMPLGVTKIAIVIDQSKLKLNNGVSPRNAINFLEVLQSHYPERLGKGFIFNPPSIFVMFYNIISPFIDPSTKRKIFFINTKNPNSKKSVTGKDSEMDTWTTPDRHFDLELFESEMSGNWDWRYEHTVYVSHLEQLFFQN